MSKMTVEDCKTIVKALTSEFRISKGVHKLSYTDTPDNTQSVRDNYGKGFMIMIVGSYADDGVNDDVLVAQQSLAFTLSQKLGIKASPSDFNDMKVSNE